VEPGHNTWAALGTGVSNEVDALAASGSDVYVGGQFAAAGGVSAQNIARWNGANTWAALGTGVSNEVDALAASGSDVYVGGVFAAAGGVANTHDIAKWNTTAGTWSALGSGVSSYVFAVAIGADGVYVGGLFGAAGGKASRNFGLWHTTIAAADANWDGRFGAINVNGSVQTITVSGSDVYVGGAFSTVVNSDGSSVTVNNIARWDGSRFWPLGSGLSCFCGLAVAAIVVSGGDVYVAGTFDTAGGVPARNIAVWNGSQWKAVGQGSDIGISSLAVGGGGLYIGGAFFTVYNPNGLAVPVNHIARWDGVGWSALGSGVEGRPYPGTPTVNAIAIGAGGLYAGGGFNTAGGVPANNIARWDGANWSALGAGSNNGVSGASDRVDTIAVLGNDVYVGGSFGTAGGQQISALAKWNGTSWSALGSGVAAASVNTLAVNGTDLYVGFTGDKAGGLTVNNIARWDTLAGVWSALGSGLSFPPSASGIGEEGVYIGGNFTAAGGKPSNHLALWHTATFPPQGTIDGGVTDPNGQPLPGARVQACFVGGLCVTGTTDSQGVYRIPGLIAGPYVTTAYPSKPAPFVPRTINGPTLSNGGSVTLPTIPLGAIGPLPPGTSISPSKGGTAGVTRVDWKKSLRLATQGCAGGSASYQITQDGTLLRSGAMAQNPTGQYNGDIAPLSPNIGYATVAITVQCPLAALAAQNISFTIYIEPSSTVRTVAGAPIAGATVTLYYYDDVTETFTVVPDGDSIVSPANRANPDTTDAEGHFGWDAIGGFYKVRAAKAGCVSPNDPAQPYVETDILAIPPPITDLDLRLDCGINNVHLYLPLARR